MKVLLIQVSRSAPKNGPDLQMWTDGASTALPVQNIAVDDVKTVPWERRFQPYDFNGG